MQSQNGLARKRSIGTASKTSSIGTDSSGTSDAANAKRQKTPALFGGNFLSQKGSLSLALQSSRHTTKRVRRTSFLGNSQSSNSNSQDIGISSKTISFSHVVFHSGVGGDSQLGSRGGASNSQRSTNTLPGLKSVSMKPPAASKSSSLWSKVMASGSNKRRR